MASQNEIAMFRDELAPGGTKGARKLMAPGANDARKANGAWEVMAPSARN